MRFRWVGLLLAVAAVATLIYVFRPAAPVPSPATQQAVTKPATTKAALVDTTPRRLFDALKADLPAVATTQPLDRPLDLGDAARYVLDRPVYLDDGADLWVTHPDGEKVETEIRRMESRSYQSDGTHVVREVVRYIFWMNDAGKITPAVFVEAPDTPATQPSATQPAGTRLEVVTAKGRLRMWHERLAYHFDRAVPTRDFLAVPTAEGVGVFTITPTTISEQYVDTRPGGPGSTQAPPKDPRDYPQVVLAAKGLLAWQPASPEREGSGVWRFREGTWQRLPETDWPSSIVQLSPFLDGTVQQLRLVDGKMELATVLLDAADIDEKAVLDLLDAMGHLSAKVRDQAFRDLQRIGPAAWPICRKHYDDQLPEVQARLNTLLKAQTRPSIGPMVPVDGKLLVVDRYPNAGILLYADAGVSIPSPSRDEPAVVQPAWICIRPDAGPELLSEILVKDLRPGAADLIPVANEWILSDAIHGPRRFVGNGFVPLLRKSEFAFSQPVGTDRRGRWLYRQPGKATPTLIIDPTLPDPTPRLPVWTIRVKNGSAGWTSENWPAIKRGSPWELRHTSWRAVEEDKTPYHTSLPDNWATTQPTDPTLGRLLLTDRDGVRYFDGKDSLTTLPPAPTTQPTTSPTSQPAPTVWPLPTNAIGKVPVRLLQTPDGKLWLFNQPGRVLRFAKTGNPAEPFKLEATFSKNLPSITDPTRIWLDPAGRICIVFDTSVSVLFTDGRIPREIATKMSLEELEANEPE